MSCTYIHIFLEYIAPIPIKESLSLCDLSCTKEQLLIKDIVLFLYYRAYHGHLKSLRAISNHSMSNVKGQKKPDYVHIVSVDITCTSTNLVYIHVH